MYIRDTFFSGGDLMTLFNPESRVSNMWKAYMNMPSKTTALDRIVENTDAKSKSRIDQAIAEASSTERAKSKIVEPVFIKRLEQAKEQQRSKTSEAISEMKRFIGKGMKFDMYV